MTQIEGVKDISDPEVRKALFLTSGYISEAMVSLTLFLEDNPDLKDNDDIITTKHNMELAFNNLRKLSKMSGIDENYLYLYDLLENKLISEENKL